MEFFAQAVNVLKILVMAVGAGLGARVIRAVALQQIDHTPYAKASAERDNEGL